MANLKDVYNTELRAKLVEELKLEEPDGSASYHEDHTEYGRR